MRTVSTIDPDREELTLSHSAFVTKCSLDLLAAAENVVDRRSRGSLLHQFPITFGKLSSRGDIYLADVMERRVTKYIRQ